MLNKIVKAIRSLSGARSNGEKGRTPESSTDEPRSRRALLAGAAAGVAAVAVARPQEARAATGNAVILGTNNVSGAETRIYAPQDYPNYISIASLNGDQWGVYGSTSKDHGYGVFGSASGVSGTGVRGQTDGDVTNIGVFGSSNPVGIGVKGSTTNGAGVFAECTGGGHALHVEGRAIFATRSGRIAFGAGQVAKVITNQYVGVGALVLATIQGDAAGTWVRGVTLDIPHNRFTILLNRTAPKTLTVGWFIVN